MDPANANPDHGPAPSERDPVILVSRCRHSRLTRLQSYLVKVQLLAVNCGVASAFDNRQGAGIHRDNSGEGAGGLFLSHVVSVLPDQISEAEFVGNRVRVPQQHNGYFCVKNLSGLSEDRASKEIRAVEMGL
ncbi:hypothetical protein VTH06DRAFT_7559 [Thermothelomyces fergusii]